MTTTVDTVGKISNKIVDYFSHRQVFFKLDGRLVESFQEDFGDKLEPILSDPSDDYLNMKLFIYIYDHLESYLRSGNKLQSGSSCGKTFDAFSQYFDEQASNGSTNFTESFTKMEEHELQAFKGIMEILITLNQPQKRILSTIIHRNYLHHLKVPYDGGFLGYTSEKVEFTEIVKFLQQSLPPYIIGTGGEDWDHRESYIKRCCTIGEDEMVSLPAFAMMGWGMSSMFKSQFTSLSNLNIEYNNYSITHFTLPTLLKFFKITPIEELGELNFPPFRKLKFSPTVTNAIFSYIDFLLFNMEEEGVEDIRLIEHLMDNISVDRFIDGNGAINLTSKLYPETVKLFNFLKAQDSSIPLQWKLELAKTEGIGPTKGRLYA